MKMKLTTAAVTQVKIQPMVYILLPAKLTAEGWYWATRPGRPMDTPASQAKTPSQLTPDQKW